MNHVFLILPIQEEKNIVRRFLIQSGGGVVDAG